MRNKSDVFGSFKDYEARVRNKFGYGIQRLRTDNGTEYVNNVFEEYCKEKGIMCEHTVPYTPQMNGKAERLNRTLVEKARCLLEDSSLSKKYWDEAIQCAAYQLNCCPNYEQKIPAELWYGKTADYMKMRAFGSLVHVLIPSQKRGKFDRVSRQCILFRYASNGYRLLDLEKSEIVVGRDVHVDELKSYRDVLEVVRINKDDLPVESSIKPTVEGSSDLPEGETLQPTVESGGRPRREVRRPRYLDDYKVSAWFCSSYESECYSSSSDSDRWLVPKQDELAAMKKHNVWTLVPRNPEMKMTVVCVPTLSQ